MFDKSVMKLAYEESLKGRGATLSNPIVGAVVVKDGEILGVGYHGVFGGDHAEVVAMKNAGLESFKGCELYTTLEPCCFEGKTGACSDLIVRSGFKKVYVGVCDVNERVNGAGIESLRSGSVEVEVLGESDLKDDIKFSLRKYEYFVKCGRPYVVMKAGVSLDGKVADKEGCSKWITDEVARQDARLERSFCDAVLVGAGTVRADDCELSGALRVVIDKDLSLDLKKKVFRDKNVLIVSTELGRENLDKFEGFEVLFLGDERVDIGLLLDELGRKRVSSLFVEGGAGIHGAFNDAEVVQEYLFYYSPIVLGGDGLSMVGGEGVLLGNVQRFEVVENVAVGGCIKVRGVASRQSIC